jgi:transposase-like protein
MDDLRVFCCQNPECPDYGQRDRGTLTVCGHYGQKQRRLLYCRSCKTRFSELKGTPWFAARLPPDKVLALLEHLADGCGIRQTARLVGVSKDTVIRYAALAGEHAQQLHDELVAFSPKDH